MYVLIPPSPSQRGGFLPKGIEFLLKRRLQLSIETRVPRWATVSPASALLCTSLSFSAMRNGETRGTSVLHGSRAVLVPPRTCLLSRLNSPNISCLFPHRNVSVITLFSCFCTFLDAGAAQDVPNLAGCPSCWGNEIALPCLQLCRSLTPPKLGNKKIPAEKSFASKSGLSGHWKKPPAAWKTGAEKGVMRKTGKSMETVAGAAGAEGRMGGRGNMTGTAQPQPRGPFPPV